MTKALWANSKSAYNLEEYCDKIMGRQYKNYCVDDMQPCQFCRQTYHIRRMQHHYNQCSVLCMEPSDESIGASFNSSELIGSAATSPSSSEDDNADKVVALSILRTSKYKASAVPARLYQCRQCRQAVICTTRSPTTQKEM